MFKNCLTQQLRTDRTSAYKKLSTSSCARMISLCWSPPRCVWAQELFPVCKQLCLKEDNPIRWHWVLFCGWIRKDNGVSYQVIEVFCTTVRSLKKNGELRKAKAARIFKTFNHPGLVSETLHFLPVMLTGEAKGEESHWSLILFRQIWVRRLLLVPSSWLMLLLSVPADLERGLGMGSLSSSALWCSPARTSSLSPSPPCKRTC